MANARQVASFFIEESSRLNENNDLTNLKLQKILYFAQVEHLKQFERPLFDDPIEAWQYGPVVRDVYEWLKGCGAYQISKFDIETSIDGLDDATLTFLKGIWEKYRRYSAFGLVDKTHEEGSAWSNTYKSGEGNFQIIQISDLAKTPTLQDNKYAKRNFARTG